MLFIENRKKFYALSIAIMLIGLLTMCYNAATGQGALNQDIEFTGGSIVQINIEKPLTVDMKNELSKIAGDVAGDKDARIAASGETGVIITTKSINAATRHKLFQAVKEKYNLKEDRPLSESDISGSISDEIKLGALKAVGLGLFLILIYITYRFKDFKFGMGALIALVHDVLIMITVYSVFRIPINSSFIAGMLTVIGYSMNDTVVIFDRIRENKSKMNADDAKMINVSINQTLGRSITTSVATLVMLFLLYFLGVESVKQFAFPLIVGIIAGTYSSIFIASPLWFEMRKYAKNKKGNKGRKVKAKTN